MLKEVLKCFFQSKYKLFIILGILLFGILFRFLWLDKFPVGINHDEADVILSAKTYWKFGTDVSGVPIPISLIYSKTKAGLSGLPSILLSPIIGPTKLSPLGARLPFVVVNLFTIALLVAIAWSITKNKILTGIVLLVSLINPWFYIYSRAATEAPFALLFSLAGIYVLFRSVGNKIFISLPFFVLAFFSYFGAKPVIPLLVLILVVIHRFCAKEKETKVYFLYLICFYSIIILYLVTAKIYSGSIFSFRSNDIVFMDLSRYGQIVDEQRRASISFPLKDIYSNKVTILVKNTISKYIGWMSPAYLFFKGDFSATYSLGEHGVLYILDLVFILLGIAGVYNFYKKKKYHILIYLTITLFLLGPVGSSLSSAGNSYFFRSFLLIPAFILLISLGIYFFLNVFLSKYVRPFSAIVVFLYLVSFVYFLSFFFFRYSIKGQENHYLGERVLANYLMRTKSDEEIVVVVEFPIHKHQQFMIFSNTIYQKSIFQEETEDYFAGNTLFTSRCDAVNTEASFIIGQGINCENIAEKDFLTIQNQKDSGTQFKIFNDRVCTGENLSPWRREHFVADYDIEDMSTDTFCRRWINK